MTRLPLAIRVWRRRERIRGLIESARIDAELAAIEMRRVRDECDREMCRAAEAVRDFHHALQKAHQDMALEVVDDLAVDDLIEQAE